MLGEREVPIIIPFQQCDTGDDTNANYVLHVHVRTFNVYTNIYQCSFYQVNLVYKGEALVVTPQLISSLLLFASMLEFCKDNDPVLHLPEVKQLNKAALVHLEGLIHYQQNPDKYLIPPSYLKMLAMIRLADYVGRMTSCGRLRDG